MDDKELAKKLDKFTEELKNIAKILKVANGFKLSSADPEFKGGAIKGDEKKRAENVAKITAKELAAALGVHFSSNAKSIVNGLKNSFDDIGIKLDNLSNSLQNKNSFSIPTTIKGVSNKGIALAIAKVLGWDVFRDRTEEWNASIVRKLVSIRDYMGKLVGITESSVDPKSKKKKEDGKGIGGILGGIAGLALLGVGIYMIVQALVESGKVDVATTMKVLLVVGAFVGLFLLLGLAGGKVKNAAIGFAIMTATILFLVIPTLNKLATMDFDEILNGLGKFSLVLGVCIGLMWLMSKIKKSDVIINILGLGLLTLTMGFVILPQLMSIANADFDLILDGLKRFGLIIGVCIGLLFLMSKIDKANVIVSTLALGAMVFLIGYLADNLMKYAYKPWDAITEGLTIAGVAFGVFVGLFTIIAGGVQLIGKMGMAVAGAIMFELVYLVGYLADNLEKFAGKDWNGIVEGLKIAGVAFGALVAATSILAVAMAAGGPIGIVAGAVAGGIMLALAKVMDMSADALIKFSGINADNLINVAKGMTAIGAGLVALMGGTTLGVAGAVVSGLASLFGADPVSQLQKFEKLDANKLLNLGTGIKYLGEGLKMLSDTNNINLDNITKQMVAMIAPLGQFSIALGGFKTAYEGLDNAIKGSEINRIYQMKLEADNGVQKALVDLNQKEVELLSSQLEQLKQNGEYLRIIASSGAGNGGGIVGISSGGGSKGSASISNFETKNSYLNHLKLTTASLQA